MDTLKSLPPYQLGLAASLSYIALCQVLRYRHQDKTQKKYPYKTRDDFKNMTAMHAYEIQKDLFDMEFPFTVLKGLQFALFRTYGIPTISKLLVKTKQLSDKRHSSRRLADTGVLISEFVGSPPDSLRANSAIARMNYLHSLYQTQGLISNDDMLYTLSLFALEPVRWVARYEWREMSSLEVCAAGTFWKSVGDAMSISYADLPSSEAGWKDGLHWFEEIEAWSNVYEEKHMLPSQSNHQTAIETTELLLYDIPNFAKPLGRHLVSTLMDERLRVAMIYPPPPSFLQILVNTTFSIRKVLLRNIFLPRPAFLRAKMIIDEPSPEGRYYRPWYEAEPWYIRDTFWTRWFSLQTWMKWLNGRPIPGNGFMPEGYLIETVGPRVLEGKGLKETEGGRERLMDAGRGGCPFSFGK